MEFLDKMVGYTDTFSGQDLTLVEVLQKEISPGALFQAVRPFPLYASADFSADQDQYMVHPPTVLMVTDVKSLFQQYVYYFVVTFLVDQKVLYMKRCTAAYWIDKLQKFENEEEDELPQRNS